MRPGAHAVINRAKQSQFVAFFARKRRSLEKTKPIPHGPGLHDHPAHRMADNRRFLLYSAAVGG
jgi:hypothetical protein